MDTPNVALIRKLESTTKLTAEVREAVAGLPIYVKQVGAGEMFVREGDKPHSAILVLRGMVFRHKIVGDGKRQIMSFHISGDLPDLQSLFLRTMDHNLTSVGVASLGQIPHEPLRETLLKHPMLAQLLWRETLIDAAIFREWIANTGRRRAVSRTGHLLCELFNRAKAVGLTQDNVYPLLLTQNHFADALGLSMVHVNRSLQELRRMNRIRARARPVENSQLGGPDEGRRLRRGLLASSASRVTAASLQRFNADGCSGSRYAPVSG